jgi:protein-disulfide isomerase
MKTTIHYRFSALALTAGTALLALATPVSAEISDKDFSAAMDKYMQSDSGAEKISSTVERYFQKKQLDSAKKQQEQEAADFETQFKNPVKIDIGSSPVKGPKDAKVTIIEFSDFECPYCSKGYETMEAVMKAYPKDVKVVFKHYPLPFHKEATPAAKASWAAQQQGKFWEFHDELFKNQDKLGDAFYTATATKLGLDMKKFDADRKSAAAEKAVEEDAEVGQKNGIQGTPGFFVNGVAVKGAYPVSHFKGIIDRWLNNAAGK